MLFRCLGVFVGQPAVLKSRGGVLPGLYMLPMGVVVRRGVVMVGRCVMVGGSHQVMIGSRVSRHLCQLTSPLLMLTKAIDA